MRDNYDFSDAIKNPFAGRQKGKFVVKVHYDFTKSDDDKSEHREGSDMQPKHEEVNAD